VLFGDFLATIVPTLESLYIGTRGALASIMPSIRKKLITNICSLFVLISNLDASIRIFHGDSCDFMLGVVIN